MLSNIILMLNMPLSGYSVECIFPHYHVTKDYNGSSSLTRMAFICIQGDVL